MNEHPPTTVTRWRTSETWATIREYHRIILVVVSTFVGVLVAAFLTAK